MWIKSINTNYLVHGLALMLLILTTRCEDNGSVNSGGITRFVFEANKNAHLNINVVASISDTNIVAHIPPDTDVTGLIPTITTPKNIILDPKSNQAKDFTKPVVYTVTAEDKTVKHYTVKVFVGKSQKADMSILSIETADNQSISGIIDENIIKLIGTFTSPLLEATVTAMDISPHAQADMKVGDKLTFKNGFADITITAEDGTTRKKYIIIPVNETTQILSFMFKKTINTQAYTSLHDQDTILNGRIDYRTKRIEVPITPYIDEFKGTALVPTFEVAPGAVVRVGGKVQQSGITPNDFSNEVIYEVTADGDTQSERYTVVLPKTNRAIIPDSKFQAYLNNKIPNAFDNKGEMDVTHTDIKTCTSIDVGSKGVGSLRGIEFFTALTKLYCFGNQLQVLNLQKNKNLEILSCYSNQLKALYVDKSVKITKLWCYSNQLENLDLTENTALTTLSCYNNQLTRLALRSSVSMDALSCHNNQLTHLDIRHIQHIRLLIINAGDLQNEALKNPLTTLDVNIAMKDDAEIKEAKKNLAQKIVIAVYDEEGNLNCPDYDPITDTCN